MQLLTRVPTLATAGAAIVLTAMLSGSTPELNTRVPKPPANPSIVVLQVQEWKSLTPPYERAALPEFTLYGGGRMIVPAFGTGRCSGHGSICLPRTNTDTSTA